MEATKKTTSKKKVIDDDFIIEKYMNQVLEKNEEPKNVFVFCKENKIDETEFYTFFGSLDALRQEIWVKFFENTLVAIQKEKEFETYSDKNKLLTMYFTLFEILTLNRSYVLFALKENKEGLKNLQSLKQFRSHFKEFVEKEISSGSTIINEKISNKNNIGLANMYHHHYTKLLNLLDKSIPKNGQMIEGLIGLHIMILATQKGLIKDEDNSNIQIYLDTVALYENERFTLDESVKQVVEFMKEVSIKIFNKYFEKVKKGKKK